MIEVHEMVKKRHQQHLQYLQLNYSNICNIYIIRSIIFSKIFLNYSCLIAHILLLNTYCQRFPHKKNYYTSRQYLNSFTLNFSTSVTDFSILLDSGCPYKFKFFGDKDVRMIYICPGQGCCNHFF